MGVEAVARRFEQLEKRLKQLERRDLAQRRRLEALEKENRELRRQLGEVETLRQRLRQAEEANRQLRAENERLQQRVRELGMRLGQDSETSSRPPSSDAPWDKEARRKARNERKAAKKGKKKRGAKKGHRGAHRARVAASEVDERHAHRGSDCKHCGDKLEAWEGGRLLWRHQFVELVETQARVVEHRGYTARCVGCGHEQGVRRPAWLVRTGAFGPTLRALLVYLVSRCRMSRRLVQELVRRLWGIRTSLGALSANEGRVAAALAPVCELAHREAQKSARAHADETTWVTCGRLSWLWTLVTPKYVIYRIDRRRTAEAAKRLLGSFAGLLTTDRLGSYNIYDADKRQWCWSHIAREVELLVEHVPEEGVLVRKMQGLIAQMFRRHQRIRDGTIRWRRGWVKKIRKHFDACLLEGSASAHKSVRRLCRSLSKAPDTLWHFARFEGAEPTNNAAERALRHAVIWRRTSYGSRSERGARFVERMLTVLETLRVQGKNAWAYLARVLHQDVRGAALPLLAPGSMAG